MERFFTLALPVACRWSFTLTFPLRAPSQCPEGARKGALHTGLPPQVEWPYNLVHEAGSPEAATQALLRKGVAWAL